MRIFTVTVLLLCLSCDWLLYPYPKPTPKPRQTEALLIVEDAYRPFLGEEIDNITPIVRWHETLCPYPSQTTGERETAVIYDRKCYAGLTFIGHESWIAWRGSFSRSAFAHELMHIFLNATHRGAWLIDLPEDDPNVCVECLIAIETAEAHLQEAGL